MGWENPITYQNPINLWDGLWNSFKFMGWEFMGIGPINWSAKKHFPRAECLWSNVVNNGENNSSQCKHWRSFAWPLQYFQFDCFATWTIAIQISFTSNSRLSVGYFLSAAVAAFSWIQLYLDWVLFLLARKTGYFVSAKRETRLSGGVKTNAEEWHQINSKAYIVY